MTDKQLSDITEKPEKVNDTQKKNGVANRRLLRIVCFIACVVSSCVLLGGIAAVIYMNSAFNNAGSDIAVIGGADGPTAIFVTAGDLSLFPFIAAVVVAVISAIGIYKTRKK